MSTATLAPASTKTYVIWHPDYDGDKWDPPTLHTRITVNGQPFYGSAIPVDTSGLDVRPIDPTLDFIVEGLYAAAEPGEPMQTFTWLNGYEYLAFFHPGGA